MKHVRRHLYGGDHKRTIRRVKSCSVIKDRVMPHETAKRINFKHTRQMKHDVELERGSDVAKEKREYQSNASIRVQRKVLKTSQKGDASVVREDERCKSE